MSPEAVAEIARLAQVIGTLPGATVLLTGSAARDELAEGLVAGRREVFSDYEFLVVTPHRVWRPQRQRLTAQARELAATFGCRNPLFHVDLGFLARRRLRAMGRTVFTFELKRNGQLVSGADLRTLIPDVTPTTLAFGDADEILLTASQQVLHLLPDAFVHARGTPTDELVERTASYLLARYVLDITTALLPHEGVLLPSYRERVTWLEQHTQGPALSASDQGLVSFLRTCLDERQRLAFSEPAGTRYPQWLQHMRWALEAIGLPGTANPAAPSPFREWPTSRGGWWLFARAVSRIARTRGTLAAGRWATRPRKVIQAHGHLTLHAALVAHLQQQDELAAEHLRRSWQQLSQLASAVPAPRDQPFAQRWLTARHSWREYWLRHCWLGAL